MFEAMQRRIQRSLLNRQHVVRQFLNALGDRPPVQRVPRDGFEDQQVECSLEKIGGLWHVGLTIIPRPSTIRKPLPRPSTIVTRGTQPAWRRWMSGLWRDVRHAGRVFARSPGFTSIAVISIAFGTGANVAMFSLADNLLLRPLPVPRPTEVLTVGSHVKRGMATFTLASHPDYIDLRDRARSFSSLVAS